ncbi:hypothetical protein IZ6_13060 [Terrihabitans soli]|uniref:Uncharacterized protein n=1 Tax=Terrihabitans soli TaxID=708113 RepID=A0A6S6QU25_9HYPH|nr:hypothetical protein [Terrihabitans soli]BCJ90571.1 hypothetical protein IZ6_13060 [Terrihabitans soli]
MVEFSKIAPFLQDPLVLIGFFFVVFFGFGRAILKAGIIPVLDRRGGYRILSSILLYGFIIGLAVTLLGFGLKYRELSEAEQRGAVRLLNEELAGDLQVARELHLNTVSILNAVQTVSGVLRHEKIPLLAALFPAENIDLSKIIPASLPYARQVLTAAKDSGVLDDSSEQRKFALAARATTRTIQTTKGVIESLADTAGSRYVITSASWDANLPILRKVHVIDVSRMQSLYNDLRLLRTNYGVVINHSQSYLSAVNDFLSSPEPIDEYRLSHVLAAERLFLMTVSVYSKSLAEKIEVIDKERTEIRTMMIALGGNSAINLETTKAGVIP